MAWDKVREAHKEHKADAFTQKVLGCKDGTCKYRDATRTRLVSDTVSRIMQTDRYIKVVLATKVVAALYAYHKYLNDKTTVHLVKFVASILSLGCYMVLAELTLERSEKERQKASDLRNAFRNRLWVVVSTVLGFVSSVVVLWLVFPDLYGTLNWNLLFQSLMVLVALVSTIFAALNVVYGTRRNTRVKRNVVQLLTKE